MTHTLGIIGTGRMATALATLLSDKGMPVSVVSGRSTQNINQIPKHLDTILVAVSDDAIDEVCFHMTQFPTRPKVALHTSASAGPEALAPLRACGTQIGVLHPLQTVPSAAAGIRSLPGSTFAIAGDEAARSAASNLVQRLGGKLLTVKPDQWQHYHAAAVMASNYQVALIDAALELMEGAGVPRPAALDALVPLIAHSTSNIVELGCEAALTGPIRRGDTGTVRKHVLALGHSSPSVRNLYAAAGMQTVALATRAGLLMEKAQEITRALADVGSQ